MARGARADAAEFERQNERAVREAREADRIEPRAHAATYDSRMGLVVVELRSGFAFGFPPERVAGLEGASSAELAAAHISPSGDGLHWDDSDVHVSLTGLVADALSLREWAPRIMGQVKSRAKARAARLNGLKGGRPPHSAKRPKTTKTSTRS